MIEAILLITAMTAAGVLPMIWMAASMIKGQSGLVLTVLSIIGAVLTILIFATGTPIGIDPLRAWSIALLFVLPAMIGGLAGTLLGWLIRRRRDRRL